MNKLTVSLKSVVPGARLPYYATPGAAGADLHALLPFGNGVIAAGPGHVLCIGTGIKLAIPEGYEGQLRIRSGLAMRGWVMPNAPGTIDSDYRGEVKVLLMNLSKTLLSIQHGERIAQIVFAKVERAEFLEVQALTDTVRGNGGFGSTGR